MSKFMGRSLRLLFIYSGYQSFLYIRQRLGQGDLAGPAPPEFAGRNAVAVKATRQRRPVMRRPRPIFYRIRSVRVWVRKNGKWKIASAQATRVGERLNPGR
jgi:hypothetical protein